jgi:uncharacterized membrane protein
LDAAARRSPSLRRRVDNAVLRWQARFETDAADTVLPWCAAGVVAVFFFAIALARSRALENGPDLASALQGAWLIRHGHSPDLSINGHNLFADQAPFAFFPLAQLTRMVSAKTALLGVQSIALACGVIPIWRISRRLAGLRVGAAGALVFAYALSPAVHDLNVADFHQEAIALPALIGATYNGLAGRWTRYVVLAALAVLCRADLAIAVAGLGVLLVLEGKRRAGLITVVVSLGWLMLALLVLEPILGEASLVTPGAFVAYGHTPFAIVGHVLAHPVSVLGDLVAREHLDLAVVLFAPLLFLPLLAPRYLLPALPLEILYLLSSVPVTGVSGARYTVAIIAFSFVAAPFALSRIGRRTVTSVIVDRRVIGALILASVAFFARDAVDSPYSHPWRWGTGVDAADARAAAELVPDDVPVRASPRMVSLFAERRTIRLLQVGGRPDERRWTAGVDALVIDLRDFPEWSVPAQGDFADQLAIDGYQLVADKGKVLVFVVRGALPDGS